MFNPNNGHFLFFLCFASGQICETYPPAWEKSKQALKNKVIFACGRETTKTLSVSFINNRNTQQSV
jgi:uroporphyrinogen-III synthase